jgi:hypothetical protein
MKTSLNRYEQLLEAIFFKHYKTGLNEFCFLRDELEKTAIELGVILPKNLGDVIYSFRYRTNLPASVTKTAKKGLSWMIRGSGKGKYCFKQSPQIKIEPDIHLLPIKIPNATPEILIKNAFDDEQAMLAKVRYNRLIDIFLGITAHSMQNHLRTTVSSVGQIEIDELYVGVDRRGRQFIVPVQAKTAKDRHGVVQTEQDIAFCREKFPHLLCRAVSVHLLEDNRLAMFELTMEGEDVRIIDQKHYVLVPAKDITTEDLRRYDV